MKHFFITGFVLISLALSTKTIQLSEFTISSDISIIEFKGKLWEFGPGKKVGDTPSPYNVLCSEDNDIIRNKLFIN